MDDGSSALKWKVATGVLAVACATLVAHALTRPATIPAASTQVVVREQAAPLQRKPRRERQPPAEEPIGRAPDLPTTDPSAAADSPVEPGDIDLEDLAFRVHSEENLRRAFVGREEEATEVLAGWLRRSAELEKLAPGTTNILLRNYVLLAGPDAVPLLAELRHDWPEKRKSWVDMALHRVGTPEAVEELRRAQEEGPGDRDTVSVGYLVHAGAAGVDLLRVWADTPPAGSPWMAEHARAALFRHGTAEDRSRIWEAAQGEERHALATIAGYLLATKPEQSAPLRAPLQEHVRGGLGSAEMVERLRAATLVLQQPALYPEELQLTAAEQAKLERIVVSFDEQQRKLIDKLEQGLAHQLTVWEQSREREKKRQQLRDLLRER